MHISRLAPDIISKSKDLTKSLKKNLLETVKANPQAELYFFDESRFGTHSNLGLGWFIKGSRTPVRVKLGFKNFYVYGAVNPDSGSHFELILPNVNTEGMNVFLEEMAKEVADKEIIMVMDGAGWHKSKNLKLPSNFTIIYLPPYSPELNPIERLWLYIKRHNIRNRIYSTLAELEDTICNFINKISLNEFSSICNAAYMTD